MRFRMVASLFVFSLSVLLLLACKPSSGKPANSTPGGDASGSSGTNGSAPNATPTPKPAGFHEMSGKIDKQDITVKLTRTGNQFDGTYQYTRIGKDIPIRGTIGADNSVEMVEYGAGGDKQPTGYMKGTWEDSADWPIISMYGDWSKTKGAKDTLLFTVSEQVVDSSLKIETETVKEDSKKPKYTVDIGVPKIVGSSNPNAEKFNQLVKAELTKQAADFKKEIGDDTDVPPGMDNGSSFDAGYEVLFANQDLISVQFGISPFAAGAAHPGNTITTYVYDLKTGKLLKLGDLFTPGAKYLDAISKYCIDNLLKRLKPNDNGGMGSDPDWVKNGAAPKTENYQNWNVTKKGLLITFAPYEVASYADGPQYVTIPYAELKSMINPSGPIAGF